jgi:hypothetical protein
MMSLGFDNGCSCAAAGMLVRIRRRDTARYISRAEADEGFLQMLVAHGVPRTEHAALFARTAEMSRTVMRSLVEAFRTDMDTDPTAFDLLRDDLRETPHLHVHVDPRSAHSCLLAAAVLRAGHEGLPVFLRPTAALPAGARAAQPLHSLLRLVFELGKGCVTIVSVEDPRIMPLVPELERLQMLSLPCEGVDDFLCERTVRRLSPSLRAVCFEADRAADGGHASFAFGDLRRTSPWPLRGPAHSGLGASEAHTAASLAPPPSPPLPLPASIVRLGFGDVPAGFARRVLASSASAGGAAISELSLVWRWRAGGPREMGWDDIVRDLGPSLRFLSLVMQSASYYGPVAPAFWRHICACCPLLESFSTTSTWGKREPHVPAEEGPCPSCGGPGAAALAYCGPPPGLRRLVIDASLHVHSELECTCAKPEAFLRAFASCARLEKVRIAMDVMLRNAMRPEAREGVMAATTERFAAAMAAAVSGALSLRWLGLWLGLSAGRRVIFGQNDEADAASNEARVFSSRAAALLAVLRHHAATLQTLQVGPLPPSIPSAVSFSRAALREAPALRELRLEFATGNDQLGAPMLRALLPLACGFMPLRRLLTNCFSQGPVSLTAEGALVSECGPPSRRRGRLGASRPVWLLEGQGSEAGTWPLTPTLWPAAVLPEELSRELCRWREEVRSAVRDRAAWAVVRVGIERAQEKRAGGNAAAAAAAARFRPLSLAERLPMRPLNVLSALLAYAADPVVAVS